VLSLFDTEKRRKAKLQRIRYVACDLDGTLLTSTNQISECTIAAVRDLQARGIDLLLVSGRSDGFIRQYARALKLSTPIISLNGLLALDEGHNVIHAATLPRGVGDIVYDIASNDPHTTFSAFTPTGIHSQTHPPRLPRYLRAWPGEQHHTDAIDTHFPSTAMFVVQGLYPTVQNISVQIAKRFQDGIERIFYQSQQHAQQYYLEVKPRGVNKATAVKAFTRAFRIPSGSVAAIGDYVNDIEMCRFAGVSAAVLNAISDLKDRVDFVLRSTNDDDGAAEFFRLILAAQEQGKS
jgi:Cof subfamily protein (haloacid dehalogenase superfamily)